MSKDDVSTSGHAASAACMQAQPEPAFRERPILFSAEMVRALLAGTKAQTRRAIKTPESVTGFRHFDADCWDRMRGNMRGDSVRSPFGAPGDRLWVRETWKYADWTEDGEPWISYAAGGGDLLCRTFDEDWNDRLGDIWASLSSPENYGIDNRAADRRWRPSIHMPRWASRITLEVTDVRVERLNDISEEDAIDEGLQRTADDCAWHVEDEMHRATDPTESYASLWEAINGRGSWDANPFVWVIDFKRQPEPTSGRVPLATSTAG